MKLIVATLAAAVMCSCCGRDTLVGRWVEPIEGQDGVQGVELFEDGSARSINMHTLLYSAWQHKGDEVLLWGRSIGNGVESEFCDTLTIVGRSLDSLIVRRGEAVVRYG